jgi:hypothetical protein
MVTKTKTLNQALVTILVAAEAATADLVKDKLRTKDEVRSTKHWDEPFGALPSFKL